MESKMNKKANPSKFLAVIVFLFAVFVFMHAKGAVHEIEGLLLLLCSVIISCTEKIITAIKDKPTTIIIESVGHKVEVVKEFKGKE